MKLCDAFWDDPSGGHSVETSPSNQTGHLALSVQRQDSREFQTATLSPEDCVALGVHLLMHARKQGLPIPNF